MEGVAETAGLTRQAVYRHFPSRTSLMLALVDHVGEQLGAPELFRTEQARVPAREALLARLGAAAEYSAKIHEVASALDLARHSDEAARAAWDDRMERRRRGLRKIVRLLDAEGLLRPDWSVARVVDALWVLTAPRMYSDLVVERGWTLSEFKRFLALASQAFLVSPEPRSSRRLPTRRTR